MSLYAVPAALNADAYKSGHIYQYPEDTKDLFFNLTARSDKYFNTPLAKDGIISFGVQRFCEDYLRDHWNDTFFNRPKKEVVDETLEIMNGVLGEGAIGREHWEALHDLGYLPVILDAVPEGTLLPIKAPMLAFKPTLDGFAWVAGYLEDVVSDEIWKATTIATIAFHYKRICKKWSDLTCDNELHLPWQCHDFSLRGLSGVTDGAFNSVAHLTSFQGTDNFAAVYTAKRVYGRYMTVSEIAGSIPATEHSVMTANIIREAQKEFDTLDATDEQRYVGERLTFKRFLTEVYPTGLLSLVSDSFNYWRTIGRIAAELKQTIMERAGKLVFRPDSGNPFHVVCGYKVIHFDDAKKLVTQHLEGSIDGSFERAELTEEKDAPTLPYLQAIVGRLGGFELLVWDEDIDGCMTMNLSTSEQRYMTGEEIKGSIQTLWDIFGGTVNSKGYKEIDPHVGIIYGDSITMELANRIFERMAEKGFASSNIVFGVGSFTYQMITRDTFGFAVKATNAKIAEDEIMLCKEPITDMGLKKSAKGCVLPVVDSETGEIKAIDQLSFESYEDLVVSDGTLFQLFFCDGVCFSTTSLKEIRNKIDSQL